MKTTVMINSINEKKDDLKVVINNLSTNDSISKNTRGTQMYAKRREMKVLKLIETLLNQLDVDELNLSDEDNDTFNLITTLSSEREVTKFESSVGETLFDIMQRYPKRTLESIEKSLDKLNLKLNHQTMTVEEK